jgi:hypothetical protein
VPRQKVRSRRRRTGNAKAWSLNERFAVRS